MNRGAARIAIGVLSSRLMGLVRSRVVAHYAGVGPIADVIETALRTPNLLQNLLGEQALSAAFIPVYSKLLAQGREREAARFAGAIFGLLASLLFILCLAGVLLAPLLVTLLAPGYLVDAAKVASGVVSVDRFPIAVAAVRVVFPMAGFVVLAAWCLGVLNSHRRFLLPYLAPVLWNAAIVAALLLFAGPGDSEQAAAERVALSACWGGLVGGALQFFVQLPLVIRVLGEFRPSPSIRVGGVRDALSAFVPALGGRGIVQVGVYIDTVLASLLAPGALAALGAATRLALLPMALFGVSVAAAELPELSRLQDLEERAELAVERLRRAFGEMVFLVLPSCVGYFVFGFLLVGGLLRTGAFGLSDNWLVYSVLAAYTLGLLPSTTSRLLQNAFFAFGDTRTPARAAALRMVTSVSLGIGLMFWFERFTVEGVFGVAEPGPGLRLGAVGLGLAAGIAGWLELAFLRRRLRRRLPNLQLDAAARVGSMLIAALLAAAPVSGLWWLARTLHPLLLAVGVTSAFAMLYFLLAHAFGIEEAREFWQRLSRRRR